jgi:hypothetical protein
VRQPNGRLKRQPGLQATGNWYYIPPFIEEYFAAGWVSHTPLTYLTEEVIRMYFAGEASYLWNCSDNHGPYLPVPETLSRHGEADLTVAEWLQAWNRLLQLIRGYILKEYDRWNRHVTSIKEKEWALGRDWKLWLDYDIMVRDWATRIPLDPATFQTEIYRPCKMAHDERVFEARIRAEIQASTSQAVAPSSRCRRHR